MQLQDQYHRQFKTLRVSLLNTCNMGCVYCSMGEEEEIEYDHRPQKTAAHLLSLIQKMHQQLDLKTVRLTGGEPLLFRELPELIRGIRQLSVAKISMTTNGFLLQRQAKALADSGLQTINVSLDAIDENVFYQITRRRKVSKVFAGIDAALKAGIEVKLNAVIMKGINELQIMPLVEYAFERNIAIRFLEVMAMGHLYGDADKHIVSQQDILDRLSLNYHFKLLPRKPSATANYWETTAGNIFGIIANESEPFCKDCDRLRLDSDGNIYGCLSVDHGIPISETDSPAALTAKLQLAMQQKQAVRFTGSSMSMLDIGG